MKALIQLVVIAVIVAGTFFVREYMAEHAPQLAEKVTIEHVPVVEVTTAQRATHRLFVESEGSITAPTRLTLAPEVAGPALRPGPGFEEGATLAKGALLVEIDPADYRLAHDAARASADASRAGLELERASAEVAVADWREMNEGTPPPLVARTPQLAAAQAKIAASEVALAQAALALTRTKLTMPFDGRVVQRGVDVGQRIDPAMPIATLERQGDLEVRLNLQLSELGLLELDPSGEGAEGLKIVLEANIGGQLRRWQATGARTAADLSSTNPVVTLIATVGGALDGGSLPVPGLFVRARIQGYEAEAFALPRRVLGVDGNVLVVDTERRLTRRSVEVLATAGENVLIASGLEDGDWVVLTAPPVVVDGMQVRLSTDPVPTEPEPDSSSEDSASQL